MYRLPFSPIMALMALDFGKLGPSVNFSFGNMNFAPTLNPDKRPRGGYSGSELRAIRARNGVGRPPTVNLACMRRAAQSED